MNVLMVRPRMPAVNYIARIIHQLRQFLGFAFLSGLGWLCDIATFTLLVKYFEVPSFLANFVSSYVGVTFVWFTSLKSVFCSAAAGRGRLLLVYWGFQFVSILTYSQLLHIVAAILQISGSIVSLSGQPEIAAKIILTPFNLVTNFLFMKFLTRFMRQTTAIQI